VNDVHVEAELVAYLDGELNATDRARVEAHLARCPACAVALEELRALAGDLDATLDAALTPVRLSYDADTHIRQVLRDRLERPRWRWSALWQRRGVFAQAMMALLLVIFSLNTYQVFTLPAPVPQETLVLGQDRFAPGSEAALRVIVRSAGAVLGAAPVAGAEIAVSLKAASGVIRPIYQGVTDASGTADVAFTVPNDLSGAVDLVVETRSAAGDERIVRPVNIVRSYKIYLASDKPAYRPSQTLHMRALVLDALDLKPVVGQDVTFIVLDGAGQRFSQQDVALSEYGIAAFDVALPTSASLGTYTLQAQLGDTLSERAVTVDDYTLPAFRVAVDTDYTFYAPGERVQGTVEAAYFFGKPVTEGVVVLNGYTDPADPRAIIALVGETDAQGRFAFAFDLPDAFTQDASALFTLEVEVVDAAGQSAGLRQQIPIAPQPVVIKAVPESGALKPGVENVVYVMTAYPDGTPAETTLAVDVAGRSFPLTTSYGLAELRFVPAAGTTVLDIVARDAAGAEGRVTLPLTVDSAPDVLLLRAERAAYEVGETLRLEALLTADVETVYLDVVRARQMVATLSAPVVNGRAVFALDVDANLVGALELRAYALADGASVADTRLVVVDAPRQVAVDVTADQPQYRPGETAHLRIETGRGGEPVASALGIAVVDPSVYALDTLPPGFARTYFLLDGAMLERRGSVAGLDVPALLDAEVGVRAAQDVAAQAAWAGAPVADVALRASAVTAPVDESARAQRVLASQLASVLAVLPLVVSVIVVRGLAPVGVLGRALRRLGWGLLAGVVIAPLAIVGGLLGLLLPALGAAAAAGLLVIVLVLLVVVLIHGWRRRDVRVQLVAGLVALYLVLGGLLTALAARGSNPAGWLLVAVVATFLLLVGVLVLLGQGLVVEGRRAVGWITTALAILLVFLAVTLPAVPALTSDLTRALGNPAIYVGPLGWMTGCGVMNASPTEAPASEVEKTKEPEAMEPTALLTAMPSTPSPAPTATPASTPLPIPAAPYPLRHIFPETLYWAPEALTGEDGTLTFDLPLADMITTWRLTALASTLDGDLGAATYDLTVFQDFFVELAVPDDIQVGDPVTVTATIYNFLDEAQGVTVLPQPDSWYTLLAGADAVVVPADGVASVLLVIRPDERGTFAFQVSVEGARMGDTAAVEVTVP
jgi:hypothetical protein